MGSLEHGERVPRAVEALPVRIDPRHVREQRAVGAGPGVVDERQMGRERSVLLVAADEQSERVVADHRFQRRPVVVGEVAWYKHFRTLSQLNSSPGDHTEARMNEEVFNMSIRKFLKNVGVTSQREIETAVRAALDQGKLKGNESLNAGVVLSIGGINFKTKIDGKISLA
jgi:hypothetical protein